MDIEIRVVGDDETGELADLRSFLARNPELHATLRTTRASSEGRPASGLAELIVLTATAALDPSALATMLPAVLNMWLSRRRNVKLTVSSEGHAVEMNSDYPSESQAQLRASLLAGAELIDFAASRAVLVGVSEYRDTSLPAIPAVANSLRDMHAVLTDPRRCGWPEERVTVISEPENADQVGRQLRRIARETSGVLLLYFAGHGTVTSQGEVFLTLEDTDAADPASTGLGYETVLNALDMSSADVKVAILDCCYSGPDPAASELINERVADRLDSSTTVFSRFATLGRDSYTGQSVHVGEEMTSFTAELLNQIRSGVPGGPDRLTLGALAVQVSSRLSQGTLSLPSEQGTETANRLPFAWNAAYRPEFLRRSPGPALGITARRNSSKQNARPARVDQAETVLTTLRWTPQVLQNPTEATTATLRVLLLAEGLDVHPATRRVELKPSSKSHELPFSFVPKEEGTLDLRILVYDEHSGFLLQEAAVPLEVKSSAEGKAAL